MAESRATRPREAQSRDTQPRETQERETQPRNSHPWNSAHPIGPLSISPEARVLFLAAGGPECDDPIRRLIASGIDWPKLQQLAESERAVPVLWRRVRDAPDTTVPPETSSRLKRSATLTEIRLTYVKQRLEEMVAALSGAGIKVLLLKGSALALAVYDTFVHRPMADIDLLVYPEDVERAREVLLGNGWRWTPNDDWDRQYAQHHHLPPMEDSRGGDLVVELHTGIFFPGNPFTLTPEALWAQASLVTIGGTRAHVPAVTHLLLHTCLHFAWSHMMRFGSWRTMRDVRAILERGVDWDDVVAQARRTRAVSSCYWTFRLAERLIGLRSPARVMAALRPPRHEWMLRRLEQHFLLNLLPTEVHCPSVRLDQTLWTMATLPEWSGHGEVRPWDHSEDFVCSASMRNSQLVRSPWASRLATARDWSRYVRTVLHPSLAAR